MAKVKQTNGRLQFDVLDLMRASMGIEREGGYAIMSQDIAKQVEAEFERLYAVEDEITGLIGIVDMGSFITPQALDRLRELTGAGVVAGKKRPGNGHTADEIATWLEQADNGGRNPLERV